MPDQPATSHQPPTGDQPAAARAARIVALIEVLICSDYPTQLALGGTFTAFGYGPFAAHGHLSLIYVVGLSLADSLVLIGLVLLFLYAHGERPRDVLFGRRPLEQEAAAGLLLIPVALGVAIVVLLASRRLAPWLHTVDQNPLQDLLRSPRDAGLFALVLVVAGGIREEVQRAFLLHRFEVWLGGGTFGVVVTSVGFGLGHLLQGADAALATGLLGALWGAVYLKRRSAVAPMVSHAGFDLAQVVQFFLARGL